MKKILREYGAVALVIGVAMVAYIVYQQNRSDILTYTLDTLGSRLVELVDDDDKKASVRNRFAEIKGRVLNKEITPAEVEALAANVLNLSAAGSKLTADEATMMLDMAAAPNIASGEPDDSALAELRKMARPVPLPAKPLEIDPAAYEELGEKLRRVLETESELLALAPTAPTPESAGFLSFDTEDGLHIMIDSTFAEVVVELHGPDGMRELERERAIVWRRDAMKERMEARKHAREDMETFATSDQADKAHQNTVRALRVLRGLEAKGLILSPESDTVRAQIWEGVREAERALEAAARAAAQEHRQNQ